MTTYIYAVFRHLTIYYNLSQTNYLEKPYTSDKISYFNVGQEEGMAKIFDKYLLFIFSLLNPENNILFFLSTY